jgi:hypothetical protein
VDERFIERCVDEELSLGDFVLTGGEIAAMAVTDCVSRMVPGVLSDEACYTGESHWDGLLEYPQYTRRTSGGAGGAGGAARRQPGGDRRLAAQADAPPHDGKAAGPLGEIPSRRADQKLLDEIRRDETRLRLVEPVACRRRNRPIWKILC